MVATRLHFIALGEALATSMKAVAERDAKAEIEDDDPRVAFVYQEAIRGLEHQQNVVEAINTRAGNLIFATAFATSLLGTRALADGLGFWDWIAVVLLLLVGALIVFMLWPYYSYTFRFDPEELLTRFVDGDAPSSMSAMHRVLAMRIKADMISNWRIIQPIRLALQLSLVLLLFEIVAWLLSIAGFMNPLVPNRR
jgi:hypothetical protein